MLKDMNKKQYYKEKQDALPESVSISADDFNIFSTFQHVFFLTKQNIDYLCGSFIR